jgi:type 1 glutamine amidotransferase
MRRCLSLALAIVFAIVFAMPLAASAEPALKALIVDGQNNHKNWPDTTKMMKKYLEDTKLFTVDVATTAPQGTDEKFKPDFSKYNVVISNYNGAAWPKETQDGFINYVHGGGGFVVVHAANNSFGDWPEYNDIIGLGGWGGRNEKSGPYVYLDDSGKLVRDEAQGNGGHHGPQHPFQLIVRDADHPVTKGMPRAWMHVNDELYDMLRGPGESIHILATAHADKAKGGSGRHEPMIFTIEYGKGRVFHTPMGHGNDSQECVGFITSLQRGAEWAATGKVTQKIPEDFPSDDEVRSRKFAQ